MLPQTGASWSNLGETKSNGKHRLPCIVDHSGRTRNAVRSVVPVVLRLRCYLQSIELRTVQSMQLRNGRCDVLVTSFRNTFPQMQMRCVAVLSVMTTWGAKYTCKKRFAVLDGVTRQLRRPGKCCEAAFYDGKLHCSPNSTKRMRNLEPQTHHNIWKTV